jgi:amide synthase
VESFVFNVEKYLAKLGCDDQRQPTLETLRTIQKRHYISLPFDNSVNAEVDRGLSVWDDIDIDPDALFEPVVLNGRGGVCYELNGLLRNLLRQLGFDYQILSGSVRQLDGGFGPELEHIFGCVRLDGELWLVDVGLAGPSYLEPIHFTDEVQEQYGVLYQIRSEDGNHILNRKPKNGDWQSIYKFKMKFREIGEWNNPDPKLVEIPSDLVAVGTYIYSRGPETGQRILVGRRYLELDDGYEKMTVLVNRQIYQDTVDSILNPAG